MYTFVMHVYSVYALMIIDHYSWYQNVNESAECQINFIYDIGMCGKIALVSSECILIVANVTTQTKTNTLMIYGKGALAVACLYNKDNRSITRVRWSENSDI